VLQTGSDPTSWLVYLEGGYWCARVRREAAALSACALLQGENDAEICT
jgi:hypothetical protein